MEPHQDRFASFEAWAGARQHALLRSAYLLTGDLHRAEDLVQDALLKVALRWERLHRSEPDAYARTVIYRTNVSWWRARRDTTVAAMPDRARRVDEDSGERAIVVRAALARLTTRQRAVLVLRYFDDLTETQTGEVLGISVGSVKKHASVAKGRLRELAPELADLTDRTDRADRGDETP